MKTLVLPAAIAKLLKNETYTTDSIGMSNAGVYVYDNKVLKIQPCSDESVNEVSMLQFLCKCSLAPQVIAHEIVDGTDFLLMEKCSGKMLCDSQFLSNQHKLMEIASDLLHKLWRLDIEKCPVDMCLKRKLKLAEYNVTHNLVNIENVDPTTFGANGRFANPQHLLKWLVDNQPRKELAVTHGDFCLPNVFFDGANAKVIDVGRGGVADKYQDIALLYRSLRDNLKGNYGGKYYAELDEKMFFSVLGVTPDMDKIDYYILLDELF
ncbi:MAG: aminoglycoside 3'-phosphotransferase [Clostridiales bacterium]|nr:aminoglycoside 3'-phosphotransferase [Clostridiales bacterium]